MRGIFAVAKLDADPSVRRRPIGYLHAREHTEGDVGGHQLLHAGRDAAASRKRRRRAGRGPLPDRSLHGAEGERATGTALAVDRLHGLAGPRRQGLHGRGRRGSPKSYRARSVPLMPQVARVLTQLRAREHFTADDDLVFPNTVGGVLDYDRLYKRYKAAQTRAGLRSLKFHDLRHSFGTMAARVAPLNDVKAWLGHADIATTMVYLHYAPQPEVAAKLGALVGEQLADVTTLREVC